MKNIILLYFTLLPVLSKVSKLKSNKLRLVPFVDFGGNDVRRSVLVFILWLADNKNINCINFHNKL